MKKSVETQCLVAPSPVVLVTAGTLEGENDVTTCAWSGNVCSEPPTAYVSIRPERFIHHLVEQSGEFTLNLTTDALVRAADLCGMYSGASLDKWALANLTREPGVTVSAPSVTECPVSIECKVINKIPLGSHDMFLGQVCGITVEERFLDEYGRIRLNDARLLSLVRTSYLPLGELTENMGFTIRAKKGSNRQKETGTVRFGKAGKE